MSESRFKFRAFLNDEMYYFDFSNLSDGYICGTELPTIYLTNAPIMQSTDLKDKNGKLIYEGDLIRDTRKEYDSDLFMIEWNQDGAWQLSYVDGSQFDFTISSFIVERSEIVGNRWENPELLKEQDDN